jgi:hypothetical protein
VAVSVAVGVGVGTLVRLRVGVGLGHSVGAVWGVACLRPISGSTVSVGEIVSTVSSATAGPCVASTVAVAGGLVAVGATVHVAVVATSAVPVNRGRFDVRHGLNGDARTVVPASSTSTSPAPSCRQMGARIKCRRVFC